MIYAAYLSSLCTLNRHFRASGKMFDVPKARSRERKKRMIKKEGLVKKKRKEKSERFVNDPCRPDEGP